MKTPTYHHDFSHLEEILLSQIEPESFAEVLEASLYAIIEQGLKRGEKPGIVMQKFDACFVLMNVFKRMHLQQHKQAVRKVA